MQQRKRLFDVTVSYGLRLAEASIKLIRGSHLIVRSPFRCSVLLYLRSGSGLPGIDGFEERLGTSRGSSRVRLIILLFAVHKVVREPIKIQSRMRFGGSVFGLWKDSKMGLRRGVMARR